MARGPHRPPSLWEQWRHLIFGPQYLRLKFTIAGVALLVLFPDSSQSALLFVLNRLAEVFGPLVGPLISIAAAIFGFWMILGAMGIKKKKEKKKEKH